MQFDEFDKKVKEAADHHHPTYDEHAWTKMEKLLNVHLPQKEENRRRFLFLLLLFIGLGGAGLVILKPWKKNDSVTADKQVIQQKPVISSPTTEPGKDLVTTPGGDETSNTNTVLPAGPNTITDLSSKQPAPILSNDNRNRQRPTVPVIASVAPSSKEKITAEPDISGWPNRNSDIKNEGPDKKGAGSVTTTVAVASNTNPDQKKPADPLANTIKPKTSEPKTDLNSKESQPVAQKTDKKKTKNKKGSSFFLSFSAGPDMSFVRNSKAGEVKLLGGAGLGYSFLNNRLTVRTGFYSGRKVYTASPSAYHAPPAFYAYYPYLEKVEADCKVYEIPFSVSYNFGRSPKQNFFASAGISSYLMKSESYDYFYKYTPGGPTQTRNWTIKGQNEHYFSTLTLSGGYQRNFGRHITVMAEPYVKLPVSGVGFGKVKLTSGGVLFTVGIKPFAAKKEKPSVVPGGKTSN